MPHIINDPDTLGLSGCLSRPKSRSHLALFETVEQCRHRHRQTEHHNAIGYLSQPFFASSSSSSSICNLIVRGSPESVFCRLSGDTSSRPLMNNKTDRNESSEIFAVMGVNKTPFYQQNSVINNQVRNSTKALLDDKTVWSAPVQTRPGLNHPSSIKLDYSLHPFTTITSSPTSFSNSNGQHDRTQQPPFTSTPIFGVHSSSPMFVGWLANNNSTTNNNNNMTDHHHHENQVSISFLLLPLLSRSVFIVSLLLSLLYCILCIVSV